MCVCIGPRVAWPQLGTEEAADKGEEDGVDGRHGVCAPRRLKFMSCIDRALGPCSFFWLKWERCNSSRSNTSSSGLRMS